MIEGGCACGALRFRISDDEPHDRGYCHCRICQRTSGAPVMVFATVALTAFALTGDATKYRSTPFGERWFCGTCGSQIAMRVDREPDTIDVSIVCFDQPDLSPPDFHIWISSRLRWFETKDDLPRYDTNREGVS